MKSGVSSERGREERTIDSRDGRRGDWRDKAVDSPLAILSSTITMMRTIAEDLLVSLIETDRELCRSFDFVAKALLKDSLEEASSKTMRRTIPVASEEAEKILLEAEREITETSDQISFKRAITSIRE